MKPLNLLVLMSDEHNPKFLGAAGHPFIETPNLDALAARGTRFTSAYTTCPICVPARAAFAVGRYVNEIGYWDNADAYEGALPSWHHALRDAGHRVVSIGKLHFRGRPGDDHGFSEEIVPMHIVEGIGDVKGLVRENIPKRKGGDKMARRAGPGESSYTAYDRDIAARAQVWLHEQAPRWRDRPWVLFVSFVLPHFPLTAPPHWFYRYWQQDLPMPKLYAPASRPHHPYLDDYAHTVDYDTHFGSALDVKRAIAGYSGLVSTMDENVGNVLRALRDAGLEQTTRVMYTSDHGDNAGARGLWGKSTLYEESAGVPLIMAGPDVPTGRVVDTPVSHIDCAPTILEATGEATRTGGRDLPGASLFAVANGATPTRPVISEYHAIGSVAAAYMLRFGRFKYCHYVAYRPQLFDLASDPEELADLASDPRYAAAVAEGERRLRAALDPEATDARAKRRQAELLASYGGREKALARGDLGFTPAPGTAAEMN
ncbi:MAG TPA: sulfatase-like hydrolase/transferase [Casimicrobiaceae bacterium]|nr:sulfatase-like hydrolase/transferase [Casimicrobiaceae bacterium]